MDHKRIIRIDPNKRFGRAIIRDTRITVMDVLSWLSAGMTFEEILRDFPELTKEDIKACLIYAVEK